MRPFCSLPLALLVGCTAAEDNPELQRFADCAELNTWMRTSARRQVEFRGDVYGSPVLRGGGAEPAMAEDSASGWSTTNVQIDGVAEADFVQNDGEHVFVLDATGLSILDAWPVETMAEVGRVTLEGTPDSLYFDGGDLAVVFSTVWNAAAASPASGATLASEDWERRWSWDPITKITVLDVTDRAAPTVERELYLDGALRTSRRVGDRVTMVLTNDQRDVYEPLRSSPFPGSYKLAQLSRIDHAAPEDWVPRLQDNRLEADWVTEEGPLTRCEDVYRPDVRTDLVATSVVQLDLSDPLGALQTASVFTRADTVFATADSLYVAMAEWDNGPFRSLDGSLDSRVHKFDLTGDAPVYTASGLVPGTLLNQFSMDEHDGFLRVATTDVTGPETVNGVFTLEQLGSRLVVAGALTGIAPGETIFAARFLDDQGFVVTFEQIDPLFTLDLSDPRAPQIVGELEVTGFSNYLHPLPDGRLLAVGEEVSASGTEWLGLQVSLFDTSDFANPALEDRALVAGQGWSEAQYDHHAFNYFAQESALALPVQRWQAEFPQDVLAVFRVDPGADDPLLALGEVDYSGWLQTQLDDQDSWAWCAQARRSVFLDDRLLTISPLGVVATALDDLATPLGGWVSASPSCGGGDVGFIR